MQKDRKARRAIANSDVWFIAITVPPGLTASSASAVSSLAESVVAWLGWVLSMEANDQRIRVSKV